MSEIRFGLFSIYFLSFSDEMMTSLVYCVRTASTAPWSRPTRMPETTTRLRNVSTITPIMSPVVHKLALRRASLRTTGLIIGVMVLTFLNLVVVSGILVGLLQGAVDAVRTQYTSDVIISSLSDKKYIENSPNLISLIDTLPQVSVYTARYREAGVLEANYKTRKETDKPNTASAVLVGINPVSEQSVTGIAGSIVEGEFLSPGDYDKVVIGGELLKQYFPAA